MISLIVLLFLVGCTKTPAPTSVTFSISNISPNCGVAGETIIITGTSFGDTQGSSMVTFNGVPAMVNSWSNTQIEVLVPNAAITGNVLVTVNGVNSNGIWFTIPCYDHVAHII